MSETVFKNKQELDDHIGSVVMSTLEAWQEKAKANGDKLQARDPRSGQTVDADELIREERAKSVSRIKAIEEKSFDPRFTSGLMQSGEYRRLVTDWFKGMFDHGYGKTAEWRDTAAKLAEFEPTAERQKTISSASATSGAEFMPTGFEKEIWMRVGNYNVLRQVATVVPVAGKVTFPTSTTRATSYYTASTTAPAGQSAIVSGNVTIDPHKLIVWDEVDKKLFYAGGVDLTDYLATAFADGIGYTELYHMTNGSGTNQPSGFANHTAYSSVTAVTLETGLTLAYADLVNLEFTPDSKYRQFGAYMMSTAAMKLATKLKDTTGQPIWTRAAEGRPQLLNGYPVFLNETILANISISGANTTEIYFGDWKAYLIGDLKQIAFEMSDQAGDAFKNDSVYVKSVCYNDGKLRDEAAIDYLTAVHHI